MDWYPAPAVPAKKIDEYQVKFPLSALISQQQFSLSETANQSWQVYWYTHGCNIFPEHFCYLYLLYTDLISKNVFCQ